MPNYNRWFHPGGTYFFTVNTYKRRKIFHTESARLFLREAIENIRIQLPFEILAFVLLPEHLHTIWKMPDDDDRFSKRWNMIKRRFSQRWLVNTGKEIPVTAPMERKRHLGVWQQRFWEHLIKDQEDFANHMDYIHYNPIKHSLVNCPHQWFWTTFHRWVKTGAYREDWLCSCQNQCIDKPAFLDDMTNVGE